MRPMLVALLVMACSAATNADAQSRRQNPVVTWGKAGVSFEEYRADSIACATEAYYLDISNSTAAQRLVAASRQFQSIDDNRPNPQTRPLRSDEIANFAADQGSTMSHYRADRQFDAIADIQQHNLDSCLIHRGYHQFRLTESQQQQLRRLGRGSDERRLYLHRLAADAEVLRRHSQLIGSERLPA